MLTRSEVTLWYGRDVCLPVTVDVSTAYACIISIDPYMKAERRCVATRRVSNSCLLNCWRCSNLASHCWLSLDRMPLRFSVCHALE